MSLKRKDEVVLNRLRIERSYTQYTHMPISYEKRVTKNMPNMLLYPTAIKYSITKKEQNAEARDTQDTRRKFDIPERLHFLLFMNDIKLYNLV